jgi:hypothetical protein
MTRTFLAGSPTAKAIFGALGVTPSAEPPLPMLGIELERLWAIERHVEAFGTGDEFEEACEASSAVVSEICEHSAKSIEDFKVKARALLWRHSGEYSDLF